MSVTGARIKELRKAIGMSQEELASILGVKKAAIHKYENGLIVNLKRTTIEQLAKALDTSELYLLGYDLDYATSSKYAHNFYLDNEKSGSTEVKPLTEEEIKLIELYRMLPDDKQKQIVDFIVFLSAGTECQPSLHISGGTGKGVG